MAQNSFSRKFTKFLIYLNQKKGKNSRRKINFNDTKTIGILYETIIPGQDFVVNQFIQRLEKEGKEVYSIEYIPKNKESEFKLKELNHYLLKDKDISFFGLPSKYVVDNFTKRKYDILINLSMKEIIQFHYFTAISKATLNISFYSQEFLNLYDFQIEKGSNDLNELVKNLDIYIRKINKV